MSDEEKKVADKGVWEEDFEKYEDDKKGNAERLPFMKFSGPGDYEIRLVGSHVKFRRHWKPFTTRVITHEDYRSEDPAWQAGFFPKETFAIHVIDRADGKLKILEKGGSLFKQFARYMKVNDVNPAGNDGPDWVITVEGTGLQTRYSATAKAKPAPFTDEEKAMIKANKAPLKEIYASTPLAKIQELWDELPDEAKVPDDDKNPSPKSTAQTETIKDEMVAAPADGDDDLFGSDDGEDTSF